MKRRNVNSTKIHTVGYDMDNKLLEIEFQQQEVYRYQHVPLTIFHLLMAAKSKGQFFAENIKNQYPHNKVA
ncbi:KTSC domain-containing protein [Erwiniaceae bacterium BAC15a-03b]|uniref:KTSC domain-containing protein n=1 Tax=Winslowiella arboricola TaxID=2978220 RepID=A0A9J6PRL4_9GAMM|nr:KTSC domain-containing protein [Winslowiella arboricola]MCU5774758.1 KTSC domain-containing protein [Winslowiella arboricola]MCU5780090.1 KTSC domain-containing protein [Winslowiella arboricola]